MNVDLILETMNRCEVAYLLIGGGNFLLRHAPVLTYDIDLWIEDTEENLDRCREALGALGVEWGASETDWGPVAGKGPQWIRTQHVFCLTSPHGAIDIFRSVKGLPSWPACRARAQPASTAAGVPYWGLADADMLECQLALDEAERNQERIRVLRESLGRRHDG